MAGNISFSFNVGINPVMNLAQLDAELTKLRAGIAKARPIQLTSMIGKDIDAGGAKQMFDTVKQQTDMLDKVVIKTNVWKDANGNLINEIVGINSKWSDSNGNVFESVKKVSSGLEGLDKSKLTLQSVDTTTTNLKGSIDTLSKGYETQGKQIQSAMDKAEKYSAVSNKWSKEQREGMQKLNATLQAQVNEWLALANAGKGAEAGAKHEEILKTAKAMDTLNAQTHLGANVFQDWGSRISNAIKQTITYTFTLGTLRAAQQLLNEALQFTIELNTEMVKIQVLQVEGAQTPEEITDLANSYNKLAKEMATTTKAIAEGSVEWLRQGKTVKETQELLRASTMLAKLGNIESAQATEYLTSVLNGYSMEASKAVEIVDKLIAVDNVAATSSAELATALRYSSAVAAQAGVSIEELISYIGTISSTTRQNAEMIGQALKTIFTRMQDIKQGGLDEDGLGLNNVERALARVDVKLRSSETEFRDMGDVLEDLAVKWDTLNEVEQANIAKAVAGVRQQNMFMILMTEMNQALELQEVQYNSAGLAVDRYGIYLKSVEASQARLKASLEGLFLTFSKMDDIIILVNNLVASVLDFVADAGNLRAILVAVGTALSFYIAKTTFATVVTSIFAKDGISRIISSLAIYIYSLTSTSAATIAASGATITLTGAIKALYLTNPAGWILLVVGALVSLFAGLDTASEKIEKLKEDIGGLKDEISGLNNRLLDLNNLSKEYQKLKEELGSAAQENSRFVEVQNQLKELMPSLIGYYDEYGNFIIQNTEYMRQLTEETIKNTQAKKDNVEEDLQSKASEVGENLEVLYRQLEATKSFYGTNQLGIKNDARVESLTDEFVKEREKVLELFSQLGKESQIEFINSLDEVEVAQFFRDYLEKLDLAKAASAMGASYAKQAEKYFKDNPLEGARFKISEEGVVQSIQDVEEKIKLLADTKKKLAEEDYTGLDLEKLKNAGIIIDEINGKLQITPESLAEYNSEIEAVISALAEVNPALAESVRQFMLQSGAVDNSTAKFEENQAILQQVQNELDDTGEISYQTAIKMIQAGYAEAISIDSVSGRITVKADVLRAMAIQEAAAAWAAAVHAVEQAKERDATWDVVIALEAKATALKKVYQGIVGGGGFTAPSIPSGGGGGGREDPEVKAREDEIKAIEDKIDALEDEKDALKERQDAFHEYIDAQKESLRLQKEEADFNKDIAEKNKDLAKIRTQIAVLANDQSQEARAKRLELEAEAAEIEEDIAETTEDRKYDLQVQALDDAQDAFDKSIEKQIDGIDLAIDAWRDQIDAIREVIDEIRGSSSGGGGGGGGLIGAIEAARLKLLAFGVDVSNMTDDHMLALADMIDGWIQLGYTIEQVSQLAQQYASGGDILDVFNEWAQETQNVTADYRGGTRRARAGEEGEFIARHSGGLAESHHDGNFAGNLKSNEVFAKLLKGEYVATEGQMDNFMKNILPRMNSLYSAGMSKPSIGSSTGDINIDVDINVNGSLDKKDIPEMRKAVMKEINSALEIRGLTRTAKSFGI